jgi:hypothetical protein
MVTTPTLWSSEVTFDPNFLTTDFGPKILALSDDSFVLGWENGTDIFGKHLDAFGSFTGGNFLSTISSNDTKPLFNPQFVQQANGWVIVEYGQVFDDSPLDRDVVWHLTNSDFSPAISQTHTGASSNNCFIRRAK